MTASPDIDIDIEAEQKKSIELNTRVIEEQTKTIEQYRLIVAGQEEIMAEYRDINSRKQWVIDKQAQVIARLLAREQEICEYSPTPVADEPAALSQCT